MGSQRTRSQEIFPDLSGPPGPGDHREVGPVRAKFQSRGSRAPLSGEETAGPRRARGPWSARERPDLAERSEAFQPQPEWSAHFPATAGTTGHRPSSGSGLLRGEGANFSFLLAPGSPPPPPGEQLQRPRRGREGRLRRTEGGGGRRVSPPGGRPRPRGCPIQPGGLGEGRGSPGRSLWCSLAAGGDGGGGRKPRRLPAAAGNVAGGMRAVCKVSRNPSAAGGGWRGCARLSGAAASPLSSRRRLLLRALTLLWPPQAPCRQRSGQCGRPCGAQARARQGWARPGHAGACRQAGDLGLLGSRGATTSIWHRAGRALLSQGHLPPLWLFSRRGLLEA